MIHDTILPLGAVIWAAVAKSPGFTPEGLIAEIRRNMHYPAAEWHAVLTEEPLDPHDIVARLRAALDEAEAFVTRMPTDKMGLLFVQDGNVSYRLFFPCRRVESPCLSVTPRRTGAVSVDWLAVTGSLAPYRPARLAGGGRSDRGRRCYKLCTIMSATSWVKRTGS